MTDKLAYISGTSDPLPLPPPDVLRVVAARAWALIWELYRSDADWRAQVDAAVARRLAEKEVTA